MHPIRIGLIGAGGRGTYGHLPGIIKSPDMELTAVCDVLPERVEAVKTKYGLPDSCCFTDYKDLIACHCVDAVNICTPNDSHFAIAMEAIKAGKPYALEKPATIEVADAAALAAETGRRGVKNMVCFSYRFKPALRYARELVRSGALGKIYHINIEYSQAWALPQANSALVWRLIKSKAGSGALGDLGVHAIDIARFVTGSEFIKIVADADTFVKERPLPGGAGTGTADVDDYCNFLARMDGGVSADFRITRCAFGRGNYQRMEIYGGGGSLVYTLDATPGKDALSICIGNPMGDLKTFTDIQTPGRFAADEMQAFADVVNGRGDGLTGDIDDGLAAQRVVDAVLRSLASGSWADV